MWCDGVIPDRYDLQANPPTITGRAWIGGCIGDRSGAQHEWDFILFVGRRAASASQVNWDPLLPADDVTGWLSVELKRKLLKINPQAAYPDRQP